MGGCPHAYLTKANIDSCAQPTNIIHARVHEPGLEHLVPRTQNVVGNTQEDDGRPPSWNRRWTDLSGTVDSFRSGVLLSIMVRRVTWRVRRLKLRNHCLGGYKKARGVLLAESVRWIL
jgi:hypothetical protein